MVFRLKKLGEFCEVLHDHLEGLLAPLIGLGIFAELPEAVAQMLVVVEGDTGDFSGLKASDDSG